MTPIEKTWFCILAWRADDWHQVWKLQDTALLPPKRPYSLRDLLDTCGKAFFLSYGVLSMLERRYMSLTDTDTQAEFDIYCEYIEAMQ
jgi:hypothetical protein